MLLDRIEQNMSLIIAKLFTCSLPVFNTRKFSLITFPSIKRFRTLLSPVATICGRKVTKQRRRLAKSDPRLGLSRVTNLPWWSSHPFLSWPSPGLGWIAPSWSITNLPWPSINPCVHRGPTPLCPMGIPSVHSSCAALVPEVCALKHFTCPLFSSLLVNATDFVIQFLLSFLPLQLLQGPHVPPGSEGQKMSFGVKIC